MRIICLFAQRRCSYEGEFAPELISAVDEFTDEENPYFLDMQEVKVRKNDDFASYKRINVDIPSDEFNKAFFCEYTMPGTATVNDEQTGVL